MFIQLPFFFGLGYVIGRVVRWRTASDSIARADRTMLIGLGAAAAAIVVFAVAGPVLKETFRSPNAILLVGAAVVVGALFEALLSRRALTEVHASVDRNHGIGLAAAGLVVIFAALEHEYGLFNRLSKFTAGSVSAEFGSAAIQQRPSTTTALDSQVSNANFTRTSAVDYVSLRIENFNNYVKRDQELVAIFSKLEENYPFYRPEFDGIALASETVSRIGKNLNKLQKYYRSETGPLGIDESLIGDLRDFYELHLNFPGGQCDLPPDDDASTSMPNDTRRACDLLNRVSKQMTLKFRTLECRVAREMFSTGQMKENGDLEVLSGCLAGKPSSRAPILPSPLLSGQPRKAKWYAPYLDYLAFLLALTEVAAGHIDSAIATLDRQLERNIHSGRRAVRDGEYQSVYPLSATAARIARLRTGTLQAELLILSPSASAAEALLTRGLEWLREVDDLMQSIDSDRKIRDSVILKSNSTSNPAGCELLKHSNQQALGRLIFASLVMKNNIAYRFVLQPQFFVTKDHYLKLIDGYVKELSLIDFNCIEKARLTDVLSAEITIKHTVGRYLLIKTDELRKDSKLVQAKLTKAEQADALCEARTAFRQAIDAWKRIKHSTSQDRNWERIDTILSDARHSNLRFALDEQYELAELTLRERHKSQCVE